ncbi:MAG: M14 family metallopeptidase [Acidobacteriota bacterium]
MREQHRRGWIGIIVALLLSTSAVTPEESTQKQFVAEGVLPPVAPWNGKSRALLVPAEDPWATPFERSDCALSPSYDETVSWLQRVAKASPFVHMISIGKSAEGRDIWMVVVSKERDVTPQGLRKSGKPALLAQAGIHPGEIDGKDAGMMLVRDMTVRKTERELLEGANLLFVPIFNVDGHERSSRYGRINQRGPEVTGWRTTSHNLNLNRDYTKLDTPEMRAMVAALRCWDPELYLDIHVTDGIDYQYDVTFGYNGRHAYSPAIAGWLDRFLSPALTNDLTAMGHIPGPLVYALDATDLSKGIVGWTAGPRYSNGFGDVIHLPTVLIENHSLKPFGERVLGTYVAVKSILRTLAAQAPELRNAIAEDRARRSSPIVLEWEPAETPPEMIDLAAVEQKLELSPVSGGVHVEWTGRPVSLRVPYVRFTKPKTVVARPAAYWIAPAWDDVIDRLKLHGIRMQTMDELREVDVEMYRMSEVKLASEPFEGHVAVTSSQKIEKRRERLPAGSVRVPTDQPLGDLAVMLLDPQSPDSFFQWGFLLEFLERTEYAEEYVMEPLAARMLADDPDLAREFTRKLADDESFRASAADRLDWFYRRTPYFDDRWRLYPVAIER